MQGPSTPGFRIRCLFLLAIMLGTVGVTSPASAQSVQRPAHVVGAGRDSASSSAAVPSAALAAPRAPAAAPQAPARAARPAVALQFEANQGQAPAPVEFLARGPTYVVALTPTAATLTLAPRAAQRAGGALPGPARVRQARHVHHGQQPPTPAARQAAPPQTVRMHLVDADPHAAGTGVDPLPGHVNYVRGTDPQQWLTKIRTFARVRYANVYPGVNMVYYGNARRELEYDFIVAPGTHPGVITLRFEGISSLAVGEQGDLVLQSAAGELRQTRPFLYQEVAGVRRPVAGGYSLQDGARVSFAVGAYDTTRPLIIDPVLVYSTYIGGSGYPWSGDKDVGYDVAADAAGNAYVTGATNSIGHWHADAYVAKLDPSGSRLLYVTYLDGDEWDDYGSGIAVDAAGNAYVAGALENLGAFVAKLDPGGIPLYLVYFGGELGMTMDYAADIAVDANGNAYVTGSHYGILGSFPTTPGAFQRVYGGGDTDAFAVKVNGVGRLVYATLLGGNGWDDGFGIQVDTAGNAFVAGGTDSQRATPDCAECIAYPTTPGSFQPHSRGERDVFITKLNPTGSGLVYSTHLGGTGAEQANAIALDGAGNAYVTGLTAGSPASGGGNDFPTVNAFKAAYSGGVSDSFYAKLNATGSALVYASYLSGHPGWQTGDAGFSIAVDTSGNVYVTGGTTSAPDGAHGAGSLGFPIVNALQPDPSGCSEAYLTRVGPTGRTLVDSTYLGGSMCDYGYGLAVDRRGTVYVTGETGSDDFPTSRAAFQPAYGGGDCSIYACADTFVMKIAATQPMPLDDRAYELRYDGWSGSVNLSAFGLGYRAASAAGQVLSFRTPAAATAVSLITYRGPDQGKAQVFIDGVPQPTLDLYAVGPEYRYLQQYDGLEFKRHTIVIRVLGQRNSLSSGTQVRVDGFKVGTSTLDDDHPAVRFGRWSGATQTSALRRSYRSAATAGASVWFQYRGTQFSWITARGPSYGQARVRVDGKVVQELVDLYSPTQEWQARQVVSGLANTVHTVQIEVLGTRNANATGQAVVVDGISVP